MTALPPVAYTLPELSSGHSLQKNLPPLVVASRLPGRKRRAALSYSTRMTCGSCRLPDAYAGLRLAA